MSKTKGALFSKANSSRPPTHFSTINTLDVTAPIAAVISCAHTHVWAGYYISIFASLINFLGLYLDAS
jgi:hypothetical protein